jgi:hypothetical protein
MEAYQKNTLKKNDGQEGDKRVKSKELSEQLSLLLLSLLSIHRRVNGYEPLMRRFDNLECP